MQVRGGAWVECAGGREQRINPTVEIRVLFCFSQISNRPVGGFNTSMWPLQPDVLPPEKSHVALTRKMWLQWFQTRHIFIDALDRVSESTAQVREEDLWLREPIINSNPLETPPADVRKWPEVNKHHADSLTQTHKQTHTESWKGSEGKVWVCFSLPFCVSFLLLANNVQKRHLPSRHKNTIHQHLTHTRHSGEISCHVTTTPRVRILPGPLPLIIPASPAPHTPPAPPLWNHNRTLHPSCVAALKSDKCVKSRFTDVLFLLFLNAWHLLRFRTTPPPPPHTHTHTHTHTHQSS